MTVSLSKSFELKTYLEVTPCVLQNFQRLSWPEPVYMRVGYVFEARCLVEMI